MDLFGHGAVSRRFGALAGRHDVSYRDFNDLLELETYTHFKDTHHIEQSLLNQLLQPIAL